MTDKHAAIAALSAASRACTDALAAIGAHAADSAPGHVVLADLDALLALVHHIATKLALALNPAAPSYPAAIPLLHELAQHTSALAHCVRFLHDDLHGAALTKDVADRVTEIIDALRALLQTFLNNAARGPRLVGSGAAGEEYLVRTGALHDRITDARSPSGIPKDNQTAVYRAWSSDRDSLEDALQEITRMTDDAESDHPPDDLDDGWDELGYTTSTSMSKRELARAKNVRQLLRLTTLLHKRIFLDLLAHPSAAPVSAFDALLVQSNLLLSTSDDLVSALYAPQDPAYLCAEISELAKIATSLQAQLAVFLPITDELTNRLHALSVEDAAAAATPTNDKEWFDTCVAQILRLCSSATDTSTE